MSSARLRKSEAVGFAAQDVLADGIPAIAPGDPVETGVVEWPRAVGEADAARDPDWPDEPAPAANDDVPRRAAEAPPEVRPGDPVHSAPRTRRAGGWAATSLISAFLHVAVGGALLAAGADLVLIAGGGEPDLARIGNATQDSKAGSVPATVELDVKFDQATAQTPPAAIETPPLPAAAESLVRTPPAVSNEQTLPEASHEAAPEPTGEPAGKPVSEHRPDAAPTAIAPAETDPEPAPEVQSQPMPQPSHEAEPPASVAARQPDAEGVSEASDDLPELSESPRLPAVLPVPEPAPRPESDAKKPLASGKPVVAARPGQSEPKAAPPRRNPAPVQAEPRPVRVKPAPKRPSVVAGNSQADARRGDQTGSSNRPASSSASRKGVSGAGDSATSNYPGLVLVKLRRALRYPPEASGSGMRGEARVRFTIAANGSTSRIALARSSGFAALDRAALETVRRASPFPAIPAGAGRSSWTFTAPLMFSR